MPAGLNRVTRIALSPLVLLLRTGARAAEEEVVEPGSAEFWELVGICLGLVLLAGLMSGLTVGLLSIDPLNLDIYLRAGSEQDKRYAERLKPLIANHHLLLVTLLLTNAAAMEALPLFLDKMVPAYLAVILSVTLVLFFGEVIPQAVCTGPKKLMIGANSAPIVRLFMFILFPIAWPLGKLLDLVLGEDHATNYKRSELKALIALHRASVHGDHAASAHGSGAGGAGGKARSKSAPAVDSLSTDEVTIMTGVLDMMSKSVEDAMTPLDDVFALSMEDRMDEETMANVMASGFSRIPVYDGDRQCMRGVLLVKKLIVLNPDDARPIRSLGLRVPIVVSPDTPLFELLNHFQQGRSHIALVSADVGAVRDALHGKDVLPPLMGIITIEDVLEEMIQEEIEDESDVHYFGRDVERNVSRIVSQRIGVQRAIKKFRLLAARADRRALRRARSDPTSEMKAVDSSVPPPPLPPPRRPIISRGRPDAYSRLED
eukprot:PLAT3323.19.p1 GENE.PLAT3323.19~~PLAT3323.19.p1  ORF type:complete len:495 (+),score=183.70 PLAT3323.19:27-1487(+)